MVEWWIAAAELAIVSVLAFVGGRICARVAPTRAFRADRFPYRPFSCERAGHVYEVLRVSRWKDHVPDMSRLFRRWPGIIPVKQVSGRLTIREADDMIRETCVAEWVHGMLTLYGIGCFFLRRSRAMQVLGGIYALGNLPYMLIQRYNRPRLLRLKARMEARTGRMDACVSMESVSYGEQQSTE